jgi:WD40 repeat protein
MARAIVLLLIIIAPAAADPPVHLGSDRLRQAKPVVAIAYSPDGKRLATADGESVQLWDTADGRRVRTIRVENENVRTLCFAADGQSLYALTGVFSKGYVCRFDLSGTMLDRRFAGQTGGGWSFGPGGKHLAFCDREETLAQILDTATGKVVSAHRLEESDRYCAVAFRADGRAVAFASDLGFIGQYDPSNGNVLHQFRRAGNLSNQHLEFSPDGKDLVIVDRGDIIRLDAATGEERWRHFESLAQSPVFAADGLTVRYFGTAGDAEPRFAWRWLDAKTGKPLDRILHADHGLTADSPDGKVMAVGGYSGHISQWVLTTGKRLDASADPPASVTDLRFSPDGKTVRGRAGGWYEWDVATGKQIRLGPAGPSERSPSATASTDRRWFARIVGMEPRPRTVEVTDLRTGASRGIETGKDKYREVRFLDDGRLMARTVDALMTFDPETGKQLVSVPMGRDFDGTASDDGTAAAVVGRPDGDKIQVARWDLRAGRKVGEWTVKPEDVPHPVGFFGHQPELSPDGRLLVYFYSPRDVPPTTHRTTLIDLRTGRPLGRWGDWTRPDVAFAADGRSVATYFDNGGIVHLREVATGLRRRELRVGPTVTGAAFSPDGRRLAVATSPGPVDLYDLVGNAGPWADANPARLWDDLGGESAEAAFNAIRVLRANPAEAAPFLKERVKVPSAPTADWIAVRVKALDAPAYRDREKAAAELAAVIELIGPALAAAQATATPEARERLTAVLAKADAQTPDKLRAIRASEVLEGIGTPAARELLASWARGPAGSTLTREATESLERLKRR